MSPLVEVGHDRVDGPVAIAVDDVATVALGQERRVETRVVRPGGRMRADADVVDQDGP
jgi:hypothetical protein